MNIFGSIMKKIFHHPAAAAPAASSPTAAASYAAFAEGAASSNTAASTPSPSRSVDVGAVLGDMASQAGGGGNYQTSIVDLLKLLGLDSSLDARKELATELSVHAGDLGTAEQNVALHKAVVAKLAENGGKVPASMMQ